MRHPLARCLSSLICPLVHLQVLEAIALGRATLGKIRQNLAWALVYNLFGIPLAAGALLPFAGIILNPAVAGGMMAVRYVLVMSVLIWTLDCSRLMHDVVHVLYDGSTADVEPQGRQTGEHNLFFWMSMFA